MNRPQPSLQAAIVTGLNILNDPEVRVPASQAEGVTALRMLLTGLASGQLAVSEATPPVATANAEVPKKERSPRRTKAQMIAARMNGTGAIQAAAAPPVSQ